MQSVGLVFKQNEMIAVCLKEGLSDICFAGYRILPFLELNDQEKEAAILHNLERFFRTYKEGRHNLFIALPRDSVLVQSITLPLAAEENLKATIGYEIDRYTPYAFDDVYFDYHVLQRLPANGTMQIFLAVVKKDRVDYYINLLKKMNIKPRGIEFTSTALVNLCCQTTHSPEKLIDFSRIAAAPPVQKYLLPALQKRRPGLAALFTKPPVEEDRPAVHALIEHLHGNRYELNLVKDSLLYHSHFFQTKSDSPEVCFRTVHAQTMKALIHVPCDLEPENDVRLLMSGKEFSREQREML
ncbi:MAG: pilus assembly protein PilM, partial [Deltaproteobacteria bacterium]|nr:pilus assembly protein PilM [Deltaproteobacteria bacterium]